MTRQINSDKDILGIYSKNREQGYKLLVIKYRERLYYHIRRILVIHEDSDDALQNTFIKVWENLDKFRSESSLFTWIFRIATNEALAILQKRKEVLRIDSTNLEFLFNSHAESDIWFDGDEAYRKLVDAILKLPEKQQLVFNMRYFDYLKYEEISEILSTSVGALKASYHIARKKIEEYLSGD